MKTKKILKTKIDFELLLYPLILLVFMWISYWGQTTLPFSYSTLGIQPRSAFGLIGIIFAPLLHSTSDLKHIFNNSIPIYFLFLALLYYFKEIALKIFVLTWFITGLITWSIALEPGSIHIGMSSIIYALALFLFVSGSQSKQRSLQSLSLLIVLVYGSIIWGIFPMEEGVSWEGHLSGAITGSLLATIYKKKEIPKNIESIQEKIEVRIPNQHQEELNLLRSKYEANQSIHISYSWKTKEENT